MPDFSNVSYVTAIFVLPLVFAHKLYGTPASDLGFCKTYLFQGNLNQDLQKRPLTLSSFDGKGQDVEVILTVKHELQLKTLALRGKPILATVTITKGIGPRLFQGTLTGLDLASPPGVQMGVGSPKAKEIGAGTDALCHSRS